MTSIVKFLTKSTIIAVTLLASQTGYAGVITYGDLTTNIPSPGAAPNDKFIKDTRTGRLYTRFDALTGLPGHDTNLSYQQTVRELGAGEYFEGWVIANAAIADEFMAALISESLFNPGCAGHHPAVKDNKCGVIFQWNEGDFGYAVDPMNIPTQVAWSISNTSIEAFAYYVPGDNFGIVEIDNYTNPFGPLGRPANGVRESYGSYPKSDFDYGNANTLSTINLLLYKDVPEPSSLALMGVGLVGLGFLRRRKAIRNGH